MTIKISEKKLQEIRNTNHGVTIEKIIKMWHEMFTTSSNKEALKLRDNIISGLAVLKMKQSIIMNCILEYDLDELLNNYTISEINEMAEVVEA